MIITIGGNIGAGKTTVAAKLAAGLNYEQLYVGGIFRQMAAEKNISIEQFIEELKNDPALEHEVDERQAKLMREQDNLIVQGRIAWYFAQGSPFQVFNILLLVNQSVGAQRSGSRKENAGRSPDEMAAATASREKTERERYAMLYGIENNLDTSHYDYVLDTSALNEEETFEKVMAEVKLKLQDSQETASDI